MCRRTRWNAGVYGVADRVLAVRSTAEAVGLPPGAWVHVDPDRRAGGAGRARALADYAPGLPFLRALAREAPGGAIKLGPASDFDAHFGGDGFEIELVSLGGECKEATAWFGAAVTCRRRASCLPAGATWTDRDADPDARAPLLAPGAWVFDPDPSLVRAGLVDGFAAAHGLGRFEPGVDYLTGPDRVDSPFLAAFAVLDVLPYDPKRLGRALAAHGVGRLEVKTRGATPRPEAVRARLRPKGDEAATLLLARGAGAIRAVLARRAGDGGGA
jgi:hypothetical protein